MSNRIDPRDAALPRLEPHRFEVPAAVRSLAGHPNAPTAAELALVRAWEGPTLAELAECVEHQFGETPGLAGIYTLGFGRDEPLTPDDVSRVCEQLGLPAEDFGVGN